MGLVLVSPAVFWFFVWGFSCNNCLFQIHHHISISMFFFFLKTQFLYPFVSPLGGFTQVFRIAVVLKGPLQLLNRWPQKLSSTLWDVAEFINSVATSCRVSEAVKLKKPEYLDYLASQLLWGFSLSRYSFIKTKNVPLALIYLSEHIFPKMSPSFLKQYIQWQTNSALMFLCSNVFSQLLIHCTFIFTGWLDPNTKYCSILMSYCRITWVAIINMLCGKQQLGVMDLYFTDRMCRGTDTKGHFLHIWAMSAALTF